MGRAPPRALIGVIRASDKSAKKPAEVWRVIEREPGWRGKFARVPVIGKAAANRGAQ